MIVIQNPVRLYGQDIVRDIVLTPSFKEDIRSTPEWYRKECGRLRNQMHNTSNGSEALLPFEEFALSWEEYDADKQKPMSDKAEHNTEDSEYFEKSDFGEFNPDIDEYVKPYYRRTLDGGAVIHDDGKMIDISHILKYIDNLYYRSDAMITTYEMNNGVQSNIAKRTEDGQEGLTMYEADLKPAFSAIELNNEYRNEVALDMLYHMKRIFRFGGLRGINYLTFISAYKRAERTREQKKKVQASVTYQLTAPRIVAETYYHADFNGDATEPFTETQKHHLATDTFDWYNQRRTDAKSYYDDIKAIERDAEILHVNLADEDMRKFNSEFFKSIRVPVLTPNSQYMEEVAKNIENNTSVQTLIVTSDIIDDILDRYYHTYDTSKFLHDREETFKLAQDYQSNTEKLDSMLREYNHCSAEENRLDLSKLKFENGFATIDSTVALFDITYWFEELQYDRKAILTDYGVFIAITEKNLVCIHYEHLREIIATSFNESVEAITPAMWKRWIKLL